MDETTTKLLIVALPPTITGIVAIIVALLSYFQGRVNGRRLLETQNAVTKVETQTNSMHDALMKTAEDKGFKDGVKSEQENSK